MIIHSDKIEPTESSSQLQMTMIMTQVLVRIGLGLVIVANSICINHLLLLFNETRGRGGAEKRKRMDKDGGKKESAALAGKASHHWSRINRWRRVHKSRLGCLDERGVDHRGMGLYKYKNVK